MRLTAEKIKDALLNPDQDVRTAAAYYFSRSFSQDAEIMGRAIQAIESFGWQDAFHAYAFMKDLVQTPESVRWLLGELARQAKPEGEEQSHYVSNLSAALLNAAVELLRPHEAEIMGAEHLDAGLKEAVNERLLFSELDADSLWSELEHLLTQNDGDFDPDEYECGCRLVQALAEHPNEVTEPILSILKAHTAESDSWMDVFAVRLAGELRLQAAIPLIVDILYEDFDWLHEESHRALGRIGSDSVLTALARAYPDADPNFRVFASSAFEDIHSDLSVQICLDLFNRETDVEVRGSLLQSALMNFATEAIEPARQFILETPKDPDLLEVRDAILVACKLMGQTFPEFEAWVEDSKHDEEFRRQWHAEHPMPAWEDEADRVEEGEDEGIAPLTVIRRGAPIGRNDPCPCGSGKKFKHCCLGKAGAETDQAHAFWMTEARASAPRTGFPVGTVAHYGPDAHRTTKIVVAVILKDGAEPILERFVGTNVRRDAKVNQRIGEFLDEHGVRSVVTTEGNIGCPHEEGKDFPQGQDCPFCPYWKGKQGTARGE